jgi:hypothetical protein
MRSKIVAILLFMLASVGFSSCSEDDDGGYAKRAAQKNTVKFKIYTNTPGAPVDLYSYFGSPLRIKDSFEGEFVTDRTFVGFLVSGDDGDVLITGEIYVNGRLVEKRHANYRLYMETRLK